MFHMFKKMNRGRETLWAGAGAGETHHPCHDGLVLCTREGRPSSAFLSPCVRAMLCREASCNGKGKPWAFV
jgi:hypothetical protein